MCAADRYRERSRISDSTLHALCLILIVDARSDGAKIAVTWPNLLLDLMVLLSFFRDMVDLTRWVKIKTN